MDIATYLEKAKVSQAEFARTLGVTPGLVWQWINGHRRVAAEQVLRIESATDGAVSRHELRADLYPIEKRA